MRDEYDFSKAKRGAVIPSPGKTRITIMLDTDVIEGFRARAERAGTGYQTEINRVLRQYLAAGGGHLTRESLRQVIREELHLALGACLPGLQAEPTMQSGDVLR